MLRRSSAVFLCDVKRGFGVEAPEEGFDAMVMVLLSQKIPLCLAHYMKSQVSVHQVRDDREAGRSALTGMHLTRAYGTGVGLDVKKRGLADTTRLLICLLDVRSGCGVHDFMVFFNFPI